MKNSVVSCKDAAAAPARRGSSTEMGMKRARQKRSDDAGLFVPMSDELLYDHPERINGPLVAYQPGHICAEWLSVELNPTDEPPIRRTRRSPATADVANDSAVTDAADPSGRGRTFGSAA